MNHDTISLAMTSFLMLAVAAEGFEIQRTMSAQTAALERLADEHSQKQPIIVNATVGLDADTRQLFDDAQRPAKVRAVK